MHKLFELYDEIVNVSNCQLLVLLLHKTFEAHYVSQCLLDLGPILERHWPHCGLGNLECGLGDLKV